jgi:hypothetical protein
MDGEATRALGELGAGGWPFGLMLAVVLAGDRLREVRRRATLNRGLHELRRPLQALVLSRGPGPRRDFEADDREGLLERTLLIPVPRTVSNRYAPRLREQAKRLHLEFWEARSGGARRLT